jgi:hypothetical protein
MRVNTHAGRESDYFTASVHVPTGEYADQQPALHLCNSDRSVVAFLDIDEVRELIGTLTESIEALQAADARWAAERRAERQAKDAAREAAAVAPVDLMARLRDSIATTTGAQSCPHLNLTDSGDMQCLDCGTVLPDVPEDAAVSS